LKKSAVNAHAGAQYALGNMAFYGYNGIVKMKPLVLYCWRSQLLVEKSAISGEVNALLALGYIYYNGSGSVERM